MDTWIPDTAGPPLLCQVDGTPEMVATAKSIKKALEVPWYRTEICGSQRWGYVLYFFPPWSCI